MASQDNNQQREQWASRTDEHRTDFAPAEKPLKYQLAAWGLWAAGIVVCFGGILCASGALHVPVLSDLPALTVILVLVAGLLLVLVAQRMWKKASSLASGKRQGALGVAMACFAYAPMCLFFLVSKNAPASTKAVALAASTLAVVLIAALCWLVPSDPATLYAPAA